MTHFLKVELSFQTDVSSVMQKMDKCFLWWFLNVCLLVGLIHANFPRSIAVLHVLQSHSALKFNSHFKNLLEIYQDAEDYIKFLMHHNFIIRIIIVIWFAKKILPWKPYINLARLFYNFVYKHRKMITNTDGIFTMHIFKKTVPQYYC